MRKFDSNKLRGRIIEKFGSLSAFAGKCNISAASLSNKLNGITEISREDIFNMSNALDLSDSDISAMFLVLANKEAE